MPHMVAHGIHTDGFIISILIPHQHKPTSTNTTMLHACLHQTPIYNILLFLSRRNPLTNNPHTKRRPNQRICRITLSHNQSLKQRTETGHVITHTSFQKFNPNLAAPSALTTHRPPSLYGRGDDGAVDARNF